MQRALTARRAGAAAAGAGPRPAAARLAAPARAARRPRGARRAAAASAASVADAPSGSAAPPRAPEWSMSVADTKAALLDSLYGTGRGLTASPDARAEVAELVAALEARNPTPAPNEAPGALAGTWRLAYTANSELLALLALGRLPLVEVGDITQTIDAGATSIENRVELSLPLAHTSLAATAALEARSPALLGVRFERGALGAPRLRADGELLPASLDVMGTPVDLGPARAALAPLLDGPVRAALRAAAGALAGAPDLAFDIPAALPAAADGLSSPSSTWLLNTYVDDDMRVARGDGGSLFVMVRDAPAGPGAAPAPGSAAAAELDSFDDMDPVAPRGAAEPVEPSAVIEEGAAGGALRNGAP